MPKRHKFVKVLPTPFSTRKKLITPEISTSQTLLVSPYVPLKNLPQFTALETQSLFPFSSHFSKKNLLFFLARCYRAQVLTTPLSYSSLTAPMYVCNACTDRFLLVFLLLICSFVSLVYRVSANKSWMGRRKRVSFPA